MSERKGRVMVVDDATLVRRYYRSILEQNGFEVEEALNGVEALEKLLVDPPDMLVVDINMPQMDGLTFLAELRRRPEPYCAIPALVTSTEAGTEDFEAARAAGANYYHVKPIGPEALARLAAMLCGVPQ